MGVESMKEYVGIALRGCHKSASRHPLLAFMILILIWIYRSFPAIFALLVDASPVIASTTVLLGTLLFFGHSNAPEIQKEEKTHHEIHNLKFGVMGDTEIDWRGARPEGREKASRKKSCVVKRVNINDNHHIEETDKLGSSIDKKFIQEATSAVGNQKEKIVLVKRCVHCQPLEAKDGAHRNEDDDKGWETGSELAETSPPPASIPDIIPMVDEIHQLHHHPEVPHHAHMSNISPDAESGNSEKNKQGDIQVKDDEKEEEKEDDQKNLMYPSDSNENIIGRNPSDLSNDPSRQESDPVESVPFKQNTQVSHQCESFEVGPLNLMASMQGKQGYNLGPHVVPEPETSDATHYSSMHRQVDEVSDSNMSSTPDKESVSSPLTENDHSREADLTSIKRDFHTESVGSPHYEDDPSREVDLHSVKEDYNEDDSTSIKNGLYAESVASSHYEDYPSREADLISVKDGLYAESVASSRYEDYPSREDDLISVKEGDYEDDSASIKGGSYAESVASVYTEDDPSREADTNSVKEGYYASEISDYVSQRSRSSDDDDDTVKLSQDGRLDEVKPNGGGETGYQGKSRRESSSPPFSDVNDQDDDEEDEYRSVIMPLTSHSEDQKIQEQGKETSQNSNSASTAEAVDSGVHDFKSNSDRKQDDQSPKSEHDDSDSSVHDSESDSPVGKPNERGLPQRLSQVQQGLTSWFRWKA